MFNGKRFVTSGIAEKVPLELQVTMWNMVDTMDEQRTIYKYSTYWRKTENRRLFIHRNNRNMKRSICLKQVLLFCVQRFLS